MVMRAGAWLVGFAFWPASSCLNLQLSTPHSPSKLIMSEFEKQNADASDSDSDEEEIPDVRLVNTKCFIEFHSHATT